MEHCRTTSSMRVLGAVPLALLAEVRPDVLGRREDPGLDAPDAVQRGADVEREHGRPVALWRCRVVVDHVAHLFSVASPDNPVVPVERRLGAIDMSALAHTKTCGILT